MSLKPTTWGTSIETGWPSMAASASMPPTPQPSTPSPLIIVVCESVPTSVSGYASRVPLFLGVEDHAGQVFEVDLVDDPGVGRDDAEVVERVLTPAEERVALAVALEFQLGVGGEGVRRAGLVDLDRVVDDQLDRLERVDLPGVAAQPLHGVAHGGQVDDRRHAGEVLEQHPAGPEGDLAVGLRLGVPRRQRLDVVGRDRDAVLVTQEVLEQDLEGKRQARRRRARTRLRASSR